MPDRTIDDFTAGVPSLGDQIPYADQDGLPATDKTKRAAVESLPTRVSVVLEVFNPISGDNLHAVKIKREMTVQSVEAVLQGGVTPSVDYTVRRGTDRSAAGTVVATAAGVTSTTAGVPADTLDNPIVPPDSFIWLVVASATIGIDQPGACYVTVNGFYTS